MHVESFFFVRHGGKYLRINFDDVHYIEASRNYTKIWLDNKREVLCLAPLQEYLLKLPKELFCKVHRAYIVSINKIVSFDNKVVYLRDNHIPIGETYRKRLLNSFTIIAGNPSKAPSILIERPTASELMVI